LKDGKRSHLSAEATSRQATVYGSACAEKAEIARKSGNKDDEFTMWDDNDMEALGLDAFGKTAWEIAPSNKRKEFHCYIEAWEDDYLNDKDPMAMVKLTNKYGGLSYLEGEVKYTIHKTKMNFIDREWHALGITEAYDPDKKEDDTFDNMPINEDLCGLIHTYYKETGDDSVKLIVKDEYVDGDGKWIFENGPPQKKPKAKAKAAKKTTTTKNQSTTASVRTAEPIAIAARAAAGSAAKRPTTAAASRGAARTEVSPFSIAARAAAKRPPSATAAPKRPPAAGAAAKHPPSVTAAPKRPAAKRPAPTQDDRRTSPRKKKK
jgi:hypothetical protein